MKYTIEDEAALPLWVLCTSAGRAKRGIADQWFCVPSWRVRIEHDVLAGLDIRIHKNLAIDDAWVIGEAETGFAMCKQCGETSDEVVELFCAGTLPVLAQRGREYIDRSIDKARETLKTRIARPAA
jgi:hypothetical protein